MDRELPIENFLKTGEVHIWILTFQPLKDVTSYLSFLAAEERQKAAEFHFKRDRKKFIQGRYWLKALIAIYIHKTISQVHFKYNHYGKPELFPNEMSLYFNISHSNELMVIAFTKEESGIGIDIEFVNQDDISYLINSNIFTPKELFYLNHSTHYVQKQAFYRLWSSKEAYLKALGIGLSMAPNKIEIEEIEEHHLISHHPHFYFLQNLIGLPQNYVGVLALPKPATNLKYFYI